MTSRLKHVVLLAALVGASAALAGEGDIPVIGPDELAFSVANMDLSASPGTSFYRYASGKWQDRAVRPEDRASIGAFDFMSKRLVAQLQHVIAEAAAQSDAAPRGSPAQQVGDFYRSYMDFAAIDAAGLAPLQGEFDRIDSIADLKDLSRYLGHFLTISGELAIAGIAPSADQLDSKKISLYLISGSLLLPYEALYDKPPGSPLDKALRANLADMLVAAGYDVAEAQRLANAAADLERELHAGQLTPLQAMDPRNTYLPGKTADFQKEIPELDLAGIADSMGIALPETLVKQEPHYLQNLSAILKNHPLQDFKDYLKIKLIAKFKPFLGTRFDGSTAGLMKVLYGIAKMPPREEQAQGALQLFLGQPLSQLYVKAYFTEETRIKAADMVARVRKAFQERLKTRDWLTETTRDAALEKLDKLSFKIGYPEKWIDFSGVDVRGDDVVGNVMRLTAFDVRRSLDMIGKPYVHDDFASPRHTLPIIINAAYDSQINGFEVPAAILQPAAFEADKDAATYFCRLGAVLGHEMTHGFDSRGRLFDSVGNMRDWWTKEDAAAFDREAGKLVDQANDFEVLPGLKANGALNVTENMADVGGINFAYAALLDYLEENPAENVKVDGLTPAQRCFISWAQLWTTKQTKQSLVSQVMSDNHAPNVYRATAALKHVDAFYDAFGIKAGDPEWLPPEKRVDAW